MKIYVAGSLNMDLVIRAPYMPENGVTISGEGFLTNPGGKGANQAAAVGKLGGSDGVLCADAVLTAGKGKAAGGEHEGGDASLQHGKSLLF